MLNYACNYLPIYISCIWLYMHSTLNWQYLFWLAMYFIICIIHIQVRSSSKMVRMSGLCKNFRNVKIFNHAKKQNQVIKIYCWRMYVNVKTETFAQCLQLFTFSVNSCLKVVYMYYQGHKWFLTSLVQGYNS